MGRWLQVGLGRKNGRKQHKKKKRRWGVRKEMREQLGQGDSPAGTAGSPHGRLPAGCGGEPAALAVRDKLFPSLFPFFPSVSLC